MKDVEQNDKGNYYAVTYQENGFYRLRTFGKRNRTDESIEEDELKINETLDLEHESMPINDFQDPFIACTFISDTKVFVFFFYTPYLQHHHFIYDFENRVVIGHKNLVNSTISMELDCSVKNFPLKCFYNEDYNEIHVFYRQGDSFRIDSEDIEQFAYEDITDADLG